MAKIIQKLLLVATLVCGTMTPVTAQEQGAAVNNAPIIRGDAVYYVSEKAQGDTIVGTLTVVDKDKKENGEYETLTYGFVRNGSDYEAMKQLFEIQEVENLYGIRKVNFLLKEGAQLDYVRKSEYVAYMEVKDEVGHTVQVKVTIRVKNENDAPTIGDQTFIIAEAKAGGSQWPAGTAVGKVTTASDPDDDALSYSVVTTGVPFKFENQTNNLVITDGSVLDFETKPTWTIKVQVSDGHLSATANVTVNLMNVNEGPENLVLLNEYSVDENTATGKTIGSFTVFDPDADDVLSYTLTGALTNAVDATTAIKNLSDIFVLKETKNTNGTRTVAINVKNGALLDFERLYIKNKGNANYQASVTVKDAAGISVTKKTNIAIKDVNEAVSAKGGTFYLNEHSPEDSPLCVEPYKDAEGNPLECEKIARVEGAGLDIYSDVDVYTNNDSFNKLTYEIIKGKQTGTDYTKFSVNKNTGVLTSKEEFDYETGKHEFTFIVTVSDGLFTADAKVTVIIDNIEEPKITAEYEGDVTVEENTGEGETVVDFLEILEKIKAEDSDIATELANIDGEINFKIKEDTENGTDEIFAITATLGKAIVKVKDPTKLNFEALYSKDNTKDKTTYKVVVVASGQQSNGTDVIVPITMGITVTDVNEKPTIVGASLSEENKLPAGVTKGDFEIYVPETWTSAEDVFGKVTATDLDNAYGSQHSWGFNKLTYKVDEVLAVDGSTDFPFELNPNTGAFTVADGEELDYRTQKQYKCVVKVVDNPKVFNEEGKLIYPALSATATIIINVTDVNRPSEFKVLTNPYEVEENVDVGTDLVGKQIVVYDEDDADLDKLVITIKDNNATASRDAAKLFEVVQVGKTDKTTHLSTFVIQTKAGIEYEALYNKTDAESAFDITLTIVDTEVRTKYPQQDTRIQVIDVNDAPAFTKTSYAFSVPENVASETVVGIAEAIDPDFYNTRFNTLYFSLEGDEAAPFDINGSTGVISVSKSAKLDFETKKVYEFYAVVTDKKYTRKVPVTVTITDEDETPEFHNILDLAVDENSAVGTKVGVVVAADDDLKNSNTAKPPTYTLVATDVSASDYKSFTIDKTTGTIKVQGDFDYEKKDAYSVRVVATDADDPTLSSFVDVTIRINDVNEAPRFAETSYTYDAIATETEERVLGTVEATDPDCYSGVFGIVSYSLEDDDAANFEIDSNTGKMSIITGAKFDYKTSPVLSFHVVATDGGITTKVPVTVNLTTEAIAEADIAFEPSVYTGKALKPVVKKGEQTLVRGTDYEISLPGGGCINAGNYTVTITGAGNYSGKLTKVFVIQPKPLTTDAISLNQTLYNGEVQLPVVKEGRKTLASGVDYQATLPENGCKNAGDYAIKIAGAGNYTGEITETFAILPKTIGLSWSETTTFDCDDTKKGISAVATGLIGNDVCNVVLSGDKATAVGRYTATAIGVDNTNYELPATGLSRSFEIVRKMEGLFADGCVWTAYVAKESLQLPEGLTAYTVSALETAKATTAELDYIPQGVPVLLRRVYDINRYRASAGTGTNPTTNLLQVNEEERAVSVCECYVLYNDEFVMTSNGTLPAGCVYIPAEGDGRRLGIATATESRVNIAETDGGTITSSMKGRTVTLVVTPADGYNIRKSDIIVQKTVNPESFGSRGSIPVANQLKLFGNDPEDLSEERIYKFDLPEGCDAFVTATFNPYMVIGINKVKDTPQSDAAWYTVDGRKLDVRPNRKGVYIREGRKVVVDKVE